LEILTFKEHFFLDKIMKEIIILFITAITALTLVIISQVMEAVFKLSVASMVLIATLYYFDITAMAFTQNGITYSINQG
jgi:hypothetical protein